MEKFLGLLIMFMMISSSCLAMTFSQPIKIGHAGGYAYVGQSKYYKGGVFLEGTTYNDGNIIREVKDKSASEYGTGLARWGDGADALYCKYESYEWYDNGVISRFNKNRLYFGGKNQYILSDDRWRDIFKIESNSGIKLYLLHYRYKRFVEIAILGCRKDGKWVKYIDLKSIEEKYFGKRSERGTEIIFGSEEWNQKLEGISCKGDTIVIAYHMMSYNPSYHKVKSGEFRFKWDEKAQWFGVEQVIY